MIWTSYRRNIKIVRGSKRSGKWMTRGMIVGDVQSGKTSHYNGLTIRLLTQDINL